MCTYHDVAKVVEPKIVALRGAESELKVATKEKDEAVAELAIVQSKLDVMQVRMCMHAHVIMMPDQAMISSRRMQHMQVTRNAT